MLAPVFLLLAITASAQTVLISPGPKRRPLFVQLYRQSLFAAARYGRGLTAFDGELSPGTTAAWMVDFLEEGPNLKIRLREGDRPVNDAQTPFPSGAWDALQEIEYARRFGEDLFRKIPGSVPVPANPGTDLARARLAYEAFDLPSLVWLINTLGDAQRGKTGTPEALELMSVAYGWLGRWLAVIPSDRAKLFQARSVALAALAGGPRPGVRPALALALAHCGRPGDALFELARSTPDAGQWAAQAEAYARADGVKARGAGEESRPWRWTSALTARSRGLSEESRELFGRLRNGAADLAALHYLADEADVSEGHEATMSYLQAPFQLQASGDFVAGRRIAGGEPHTADAGMDFSSLVGALRGSPAGDPAEEIPASARAELLLDFALDAAVARIRFVVHSLGMPADGRALAAAAQPLAQVHPWGFLLPLIREDREKERGLEAVLLRGLSGVRAGYGGAHLLIDEFHDVNDFNPREWVVSRESEFDDATGDFGLVNRPPYAPEVLTRLSTLNPYSPIPYGSGSEALLDQGLAKLGERPDLLVKKLGLALERRPRDLEAVDAAAGRLLAVDRMNWVALTVKTGIRIAKGEFEKAAEAWREFVRLKPDTLAAAHAVALMSWAYSAGGDFRRARELAVAAAPAFSHTVLLRLAHAYEETGRYDLAEDIHGVIQWRYPSALSAHALGKFLMRTGDPRGYGLVRAGIPWFFSHQQEPGVVLTDSDHQDLFHAFLFTEDWKHAFQLINTVLVPRWHPDDADFLLWLAVAEVKAGEGGFTDAAEMLGQAQPKIAKSDPLYMVVEAYLRQKTPEEAEAELPLEPGLRALGYYFLAEFRVLSRSNPDKATALFEAAAALRQYEQPAHYLALKSLGKVPSFLERLWRHFKGIVADASRAPDLARRAFQDYGN